MTALRIPEAGPMGSTGLIAPHHRNGVYLQVPDIITFVTSPQYLNRPLYPRQATMLKCIFLGVSPSGQNILTDYDRRVIEEWETNFRMTRENGVVPGMLDRMEYLRDQGYRWFNEVLLVMGRRAGKGYVSALAMAYVLWNYMAVHDPQRAYQIDRDKRMECLIYAGRKEQARDNLWRDLYNIIKGAPCFAPYISKPMGESITIDAPADAAKRMVMAKRGIQSGLDLATFRIIPLPATPMSGRGGASFMLGFDEMGHMVATGANRSSEEVWVAATPSLDQFKKDKFIVCPSSPWEMIGQFYVEWEHSQERDEDTGGFLYPEIFMIQLASWEIYFDWETAHELPMFPEEYLGDYDEYAAGDVPCFPGGGQKKFFQAVQEYDDQMKRLEKADPDMFAVERLSHWQTALDAYLDPRKIAAMFERGEERGLSLPPRANGPDLHVFAVPKGILSQYYKGHADPSFANDNFGVAVAHLEKNEDGFDVVVFDYIHHWQPSEWPQNTIDYTKINEYLWDLIKGYPIDDFTFDQYQSQYFVAEFTKRSREAPVHKRINIGIVPSTAPYNFSVAENFKIALNQGWVYAPYYEQADLELRFLQLKNGKVTHQTAGPVQHDDVARCLMEVTYDLLNQQVSNYLMQGVPMTAALSGGIKPWMQADQHDMDVIGQFSAPRRGRTGLGPAQPSRGKTAAQQGRGPLPRTPGRLPGYRGR